jgi:hypothetical protein
MNGRRYIFNRHPLSKTAMMTGASNGIGIGKELEIEPFMPRRAVLQVSKRIMQ